MRDYIQAMPRKMRRAALCSALTAKAADSGLIFVEDLKLDEPKTSLMVKALDTLAPKSKTLILIADKGPDFDNVITASRNLVDAKLLMVNYLNIRDLLTFNKVIVPLKSLDVIKSFLG
jgi:large subunit ribosomal protein L4